MKVGLNSDKYMIWISKYYTIINIIAQFIETIENLFAHTFLAIFAFPKFSIIYSSYKDFSFITKFEISTKSQRNLFYKNKAKILILSEEIKIPGITI